MTDSPSAPAATAVRVLIVDAANAGKRLDLLLTALVPELSRARVRAMVDAREVRVNGRVARKGDPVAEGDRVELMAPPRTSDFPAAPDASLSFPIRFEDASLVAIDKPAGIASHPLRPDELGTVANFVVARFPETASIGFARREPGLVQRLDTDTSGLILVARTTEVFETIRTATRSGTVTKRYLALVEGTVEAEGRVDYPLVPHRKDPKRVEAVTPHVRLRAGTRTHEAHTWYRPVRSLKHGERRYTLLEIELRSAFRHQVRVHLATVGFPLVADALYRGPSLPEGLTLDRHFLHASELQLPHPVTGEALRITSPLPNDLASVLGALKAITPG